MSQPTKEQVLAALRLNDIHVDDVPGYRLTDGGNLEVQLDRDGGVVLLLRSDWTPTRMCSAGAECVGRTSCPRPIGCDQ